MTNNDPALLKPLRLGKFRDCYLIYNRKSTDDTENQKNSIQYQRSENGRFALHNHLPIAALTIEGFCTHGIVSERHSGFKEDVELLFGDDNLVQYRVERPKFHRLVQFLSHGYFKGVIFLCWDRASRNKGDDTILRKLMKAGVDIRFALAQYDKTSAGELHMDIDGMFAEHHSRVTREKVTLTIRTKRKEGFWLHMAGVGYLNLGTPDHKPFDSVRAPIIKQLFDRAATGEWSLADLARWAIEQGFTMPPKRRRRTPEEVLAEEDDDVRLKIEPIARIPTPNSIHNILTNRFYTGRVSDSDGAWVRSRSHEALVSDELFDRVQRRLHQKNRSAHYVDLLEHVFRGFMHCGGCGRVYTPYLQKGITYYGSRCRPECQNSLKHFSFSYIAGRLRPLFVRLALTPDERAQIERRASTDIAPLDAQRTKRLEEKERQKVRIREDLAYLNANRLVLLKTGAYTPEALSAEELKLNLELTDTNDVQAVSGVSVTDAIREAEKLSELLNNVISLYDSPNYRHTERIVRIVFSELTVSETSLQYQCVKGFSALEGRFVAEGGLVGWISELSKNRGDLADSIRETEALISSQKVA